MVSAMESGDGSVSRPAPDSGTTSRTPPPSQHATTGTPHISASAGARPNPSPCAGKIMTSALARNPATSGGGTAPAKVTNGAMPSRST